MKITLTLICTIFFLQIASAQESNDKNAPQLWEKYTAKYFKPKFVLDDKPIVDDSAKSVLDEVDPWSVTKLLVAHGNPSQPRDVLYISTGRVKIRAYQQKLAKFSAPYDKYLKSHKYWDGRFLYILNGQAVSGSTKDIIDILFDIQENKITNVYFKEEDEGNWATAMMQITTKH